jgi:hypothetical protein
MFATAKGANRWAKKGGLTTVPRAREAANILSMLLDRVIT